MFARIARTRLPCPRRVTGNHLHGRLATTVERSPTTKRWDALKAADISASRAVATFADPGTLKYPRIETRLVLGRNLSLGCTITFASISFGTGRVPVRGLQLECTLDTDVPLLDDRPHRGGGRAAAVGDIYGQIKRCFQIVDGPSSRRAARLRTSRGRMMLVEMRS